jgi:hypothetical protein
MIRCLTQEAMGKLFSTYSYFFFIMFPIERPQFTNKSLINKRVIASTPTGRMTARCVAISQEPYPFL